MRDGTGFQTALHFEDGRMSLLGVGVGMIGVVGITTGFEPGIYPPVAIKVSTLNCVFSPPMSWFVYQATPNNLVLESNGLAISPLGWPLCVQL